LNPVNVTATVGANPPSTPSGGGGDAGPLSVMAALGLLASNAVPKTIRQPLRGTLVHSTFSVLIWAMHDNDPRYNSEVSYFNQNLVWWGFKGSVRADAVFGDIGRPDFIVELKTGNAKVTKKEAAAYHENLPRGTRAYWISVPP
jgi:hypothetical protein